MSKPSNASKAGLDARITPTADGRNRIRLTDDQGTVVFDRTYSGTEKQAKDKAAIWVREHYQVETREAPRTRKAATSSRNLGPTPQNLIGVMRARADDNESRAIALRGQADGLEIEAKRLREAADALEGPDGQQA